MSYASVRICYLPWAILAVTGCSQSQGGGDAWRAERTTADGVQIVRTLSGSTWQGSPQLVEELTFGVVDGAQEYMFGQINQIAPDGRGGAYVFDGQVPALRHYDSTGSYTRTFGRAGGGPGEYQSPAMGLAVLSDGRIVLLDPQNARFNVYAPDGTALEHWPRPSGLFTNRAMYVDTGDHIYTRIMTGLAQPGEPIPPVGLLHLSPQGETLDTILAPSFPGEPDGRPGILAPVKIWDLHRDGYPVVGVSDRYAIELRKPEGTVRIEKVAERIPVNPEEQAEREAYIAYLMKRSGGRGPSFSPVPNIKPYFQSIYVGDDGTIWVRTHQPGIRRNRPVDDATRSDGMPQISWTEPTVFDVFESDGTYLGEVHVPQGTILFTYARDRVWATREGEQGETLVTRLRLVEPEH